MTSVLVLVISKSLQKQKFGLTKTLCFLSQSDCIFQKKVQLSLCTLRSLCICCPWCVSAGYKHSVLLWPLCWSYCIVVVWSYWSMQSRTHWKQCTDILPHTVPDCSRRRCPASLNACALTLEGLAPHCNTSRYAAMRNFTEEQKYERRTE